MSGEDAAAGAKALAGLDHVLAQKPHKDDETLTDVVKQVCILREALIARKADPDHTRDDRIRLDHANAIISVILAVQFPLGETPWDELAKARDWLQPLVPDGV